MAKLIGALVLAIAFCEIAAANVAISQSMALLTVAPSKQVERCIDRASVRRQANGMLYFRLRECGTARAPGSQAFRVNCRQSAAGPYLYERLVQGKWLSVAADRSDEMGQIIRQLCRFEVGRLPPEEPRP